MRLSQEAIRRMMDGRSGGGAGGGGSFDPSLLAGYATQAWTEENYISKTFFSELFIVHKKVTTVVMDGETEISRTVTTNSIFAPNEIPGTTTETDEETGYVTTVTTEIASIESKKGFWTNYFISALGLNSEGGGGGLTLNEPLATINVSGLANHPSSSCQTIVWNGSAWVYGTAGGTGTVTGVKVGDITYSPVNGIVSIPEYPTSLAWSAITSKPTTIAGYGITDAKIENGVITLGSNTITPLTSSAITDMATKTWVGNNYLPLTGGTLSISGIGGFTVKNMASNYPLIRFEGNASGGIGFIGIGKNGDSVNPYYVTADSNGGYTEGESQWNILLHAGNYTNYTYSKSYIDTELAKKLDVAFFDALFQAYAGSTKVIPNASTSSVDNIKAMFGFWTQQYISALGKNDSQGVVSALSDLSDVTITSPSNGQALIYDGGIWKNGAAGMNMSELTTYLSSKILTVKNGTATLGTWNPTAAGTIDIASAVSGYVTALGTNGDYLTWTKNGTANNLTVPYATHATRLAQSDLAKDGDLSQFTHATDLIYAAKGGGNTVTDKPTGVDAFGVLSFKTAAGYNGQMLLDAVGVLYVRSSNSLSGVAWKKMLDSANTYVTSGKGYINGTEITAISGNAATASRLADNTAKTAWGQTYWQNGVPQNVSGNMTGVGSITMSGVLTVNNSNGIAIWDTTHTHDMDFFWTTYQVAEEDTRDIFTMYAYETRYWDMCIGTHPNAIGNKSLYYNGSTMRWGIGTANPTYTLDVIGTAKATTIRATDIYIGGIHITADNNGVHINSAGLYADTYVSALGLNDSHGVVSALSDLVDVNIVNPTNGQVLKYNATTEEWYNGNDEGVTSLAWSQITGKPTTIAGYGITDAKIVNGTITLGSNSITPLTSSAITDMATKTWVGNNYLPLAGGTMTGNVLHKSSTLQRGVAPDARTVMYRSWCDKDNKYIGWFEFVSETNGDNAIGLYVLSNITSSDNAYGGLNIRKSIGDTGNYITIIDANTGELSSRTLKSTVATGTAPLTIASTTLVSNLNADLLDGQHASYFATAANLTTANGKITTLEGYFDNGVANSAKRLSGTSSYTAWGRTYWSSGVPQNVSGNIDVNTGEFLRLKDGTDYYRIIGISSDSTLLIGWDMRSQNRNTTISTGKILNIGYGTNASDTSYGKYWTVFLDNGHVTINSNDDTEVTRNIFLNIGGNTKTNRLYLHTDPNGDTTNDVYLVYENGGVHVVGGGLYADTYVSALGLSDSGGSAFDETAMWQALGTDETEKQISSTYLTNALAPYALKTDIPSLKSLSWSYGSVTSASGGSYNGSEVTSFVIPKNTSHLTNDSGFITSSALGAYLPLTGGTLSLPGIGYLTIKNTASDYPLIRFEGKTAGGLGFIGVNAQKQPVFVTVDNNGGYTDGVSQWNTIWHSGNDSALLSSFVNSGDNVSLTVGSTTKTLTVGYATRALRLKNIVMAAGDDYDTLSGYTADRGSFVAVNINSVPSSSMTLSGMDNNWATLLSFGYNNRTIQFMGFGWSDTLKYRHVYTEPGTTSTYVLSPWKTIAFTDGNVASATRLAGTATKSAWGQTYWSNGQPQDISGNMTSVGNITPSSSGTYNIGTRSNYYNGVYCDYLNLIDPTTNEDFNITWTNTDNKRVLAMYCWETVMSDMILGATNSSYGLYFNGTNGRWGIGTSVPGQRFGSENVGLKLDVAGIARANVLQTYNSYGETMLLNSTATYDCIVFQINSASKWSVGADSSNNFYWYTQPGGGQTVMYLTSAGVLNVGNSVKCTDLWIGNIHITYDSTNGGIHIANGGLSANTYVSALGVGQEGGGTQGLDIEAMWTELATPNSARQIDSSHISNALSGYVTTNTLNGYATQQWVNSQGFAYASSLSNYVSAVSMSSGQLNVTKGGTTTSTDIVALRLGQSALGNSASLATFTHSTDLIYTAKGGNNSCTDKPTGVDSFGLIALKTADSYYGQMLMTSGGEVYTRASNSLSGGWRRQLDSLNWSTSVTLSALGGASTVALTEATTRISTLEGYFNTGGVAKKAAKLNTAVTINGTSFDGSASITTRSWGTARTITLADHDSSNTHANNGIDGSENITLYLPSTIRATLNGNASSATTATTASKLSTVSKTAWGQTYWTSGGVPTDVSGSIEAGNSGGYIGGFDHIDLNTHASLLGYGGYIDFYYEGANSYTSRIIEENSGLLALRSPYTLGLLVGGYNGDYVQIGQIRIVYESSNNALRIENANNGGAANLYAMGGISALGMSGNADGTVSGNLTPSTSDTYTLGSSSARWKALYLGYSSSRTLEIKPTSYDISFNSSGSTQFTFNNDMEVGGDLYVNDHLGVGDTNTDYALYVYGTAYITGNISAASVTNRSDMRLKDFVENINLSVESIAAAPCFKYTFKKGDSRLMAGTSAQYWRGVLPEVVFTDADTMLSLDYGVTALAGVISVARKVMTHEEEIAALKRRIGELENEIETLKAA